MAKINQRIDRLTNSIANKLSGDSFDTDVIAVTKTELKTLTKKWKFNWVDEDSRGKVFKLVISHYPTVIQGLVSLIDKNDHLFMNLVENAPHNFGKNKIYEGVLGNLVAFACKHSFDKGYDGFVAFEAKTKLTAHYTKTLKAKVLVGNRMFIDTNAAIFLIDKYFNK